MYFAKNVLASLLTFSTNLSEVDTFVVKHLNAVSSVIRNENFLPIVDHYPIGELQVLGAAKLVEDVAGLVEDDHAHHLALHDDDATFVVDGDAPGVLKNIGTEFAYKLTILVVDLDLK